MKVITAATVAMLAFTVAVPKAEAHVIPLPVPANLEVPADNRPYLIGHAYGTQNYVCLLGNNGFAWTFFGPQATLFSDEDRQLITHFLSANPAENGTLRATWQHSRDTSAVRAVAIANSTDPAYVQADAIPWLLLQVVGAQEGPTGGFALTRTTFVQRVNTNGGVAPAIGGCSQAADIGKKALVPYAADYVFYR